MSPERRARNAADTERMLAELPLGELRRARDYTQTTLAELLGTSQGEVSKIEQRADMYVSTLRRYVEAMGGSLDIVARFPEGAVRITQFRESMPEPAQATRVAPHAAVRGGAPDP
jgi:transcriptional regulator with XRE-family HTH domain